MLPTPRRIATLLCLGLGPGLLALAAASLQSEPDCKTGPAAPIEVRSVVHPAALTSADAQPADPDPCGDHGDAAWLSVDGEPFVPLRNSSTANPVAPGEDMLISLRGDVTRRGFALPERNIAWVKLAPSGHQEVDARPTRADLLYWYYRAADTHGDPDRWLHSDNLAGTVTFHEVGESVGDSICGEFDLSLEGEHRVQVKGRFHHVVGWPRSGDDIEVT